jgi:hypothetical protein
MHPLDDWICHCFPTNNRDLIP